MAKSLILLTIFLVPLFTPAFGLGYEQIKAFAFLVLVSLITILWLKDQSKHPKLYKFSYSKIKIASIIFILILLLTSILGVDPLNSIIGRPPYYQGLIVYAYLLLFSFFISAYKLTLEDTSKALTASSLAVSLFALKDLVLFKLLDQSVPLYDSRVVSTFGQPNFYAGYLLISLPFIYFLCFQSGIGKLNFWKIFAGFTLLLSILAIGLSGSRTSLVLAFLAILIGIIGYINFKGKIMVIILSLLVLFGSINYAFQNSSGLVLKEYLQPLSNNIHGFYQTSPEKRILIWPIIIELIKERPFLGYGLDSMNIIYPGYFSRFKVELGPLPIPYYDLRNLVLDRSHNYLMDLLLFAGVLGLLGWLGIVGMIIRSLFPLDARRYTLITSLLLYILFIQFQNQSIAHLLFFWGLIGLIDSSN